MGSHWSRVPFTALKVTLCALPLCKDRNACRFWCDHGTAPTPPGPHLPTPKRWNTHTRKRATPLRSHNQQVPQNRPPTPPEDYPVSCDSVARSVRPGTHRVMGRYIVIGLLSESFLSSFPSDGQRLIRISALFEINLSLTLTAPAAT